MMQNDKIKLLDCTLRDGGYINNWIWGKNRAVDIILKNVQAGTDIIELGFLRDDGTESEETVIFNNIEAFNNLISNLQENYKFTQFAVMVMNGSYNDDMLSEFKGTGVELIRVTAHENDIWEGIELAKRIGRKGYKVSFNPINIMGYTNEQILEIVQAVNTADFYQFSIVDTFGSMRRRDLIRILDIIEENLDEKIRIGLHLHENLSLANSLAQYFIDRDSKHGITIDGSLNGIGRNPGNLPLEVIADYLNESTDKYYEIDYMLDAIYDYISPLKGKTVWGYSPEYFLSARFNLHRNYAEYYINKGNLTAKDMNHILSDFSGDKKTVFDKEYAEVRYQLYMNNHIDDTEARIKLQSILEGRNVLIIAPGKNYIKELNKIIKYVVDNNPIVISVNFVPSKVLVDFCFCSNNKRFQVIKEADVDVILTSNLNGRENDIIVDYDSISGTMSEECNSLIMIIRLLSELGINRVVVAGADGYVIDDENYYSSAIRSFKEHDDTFNKKVACAISNLKIDVSFLTSSAYEKHMRRK